MVNKYNPSTSVHSYRVMARKKIYAELIGNYKNQRIKSLWDNNLAFHEY
jgi:hypothetical protein